MCQGGGISSEPTILWMDKTIQLLSLYPNQMQRYLQQNEMRIKNEFHL